MSQIALDGELIRLKSCKLALSMQLADQDMSGQSSSTQRSEQGDKAKELKVSGLIPFKDAPMLARLFELAAMRDDNGNRKVSRIGAELARSAKIRQVKFFGQISAPEHASLMAWTVSFQLREILSTAEVDEQRKMQAKSDTEAKQGKQKPNKAPIQTQTMPTQAMSDAPPAIEMSSTAKVLHYLDDALGGDDAAN